LTSGAYGRPTTPLKELVVVVDVSGVAPMVVNPSGLKERAPAKIDAKVVAVALSVEVAAAAVANWLANSATVGVAVFAGLVAVTF
jgi:hypothetical protein